MLQCVSNKQQGGFTNVACAPVEELSGWQSH